MDELLKPGDAQFEIVWANRHTSKAGKESIKLRLRCNQGNTSVTVYNYLSLNNDKRLQAFKAALSRCPLDRLTDADDEELLRLKGLNRRCVVDIEHSENYPARNVIKFWSNFAPKTAKPLSPPERFAYGTNEETVPPMDAPDNGWADLENLPF
jgi:hypothetical protein